MLLVLGFGSSEGLAGAYGIAIALAMAIPYAVVQIAYGPERVAATAAIRSAASGASG